MPKGRNNAIRRNLINTPGVAAFGRSGNGQVNLRTAIAAYNRLGPRARRRYDQNPALLAGLVSRTARASRPRTRR